MHPVPTIAVLLETRPMAVLLNRFRRLVQIEIDVIAAMVNGLSEKGRKLRLVAACVGIAVARPASFLPVGQYAPLHLYGGAVPPNHARE